MPPVFNGGSPLLDYRIWYDESNGPEYVVLVENHHISFVSFIATGLTQGLTYSFKVEVRNAYGHSAFSNSVEILAAQEPV